MPQTQQFDKFAKNATTGQYYGLVGQNWVPITALQYAAAHAPAPNTGGVSGSFTDESPTSAEAIAQEKNPAMRSLRYLTGEGQALDKFAVGIPKGIAKLIADFGPALGGTDLLATQRAGEDVVNTGKGLASIVTALGKMDTLTDPQKFASEVLNIASLYPLGGPVKDVGGVAADIAESGTRNALRGYTGTGEDFAQELAEKRAQAVADNESSYAGKLAEAKKGHEERLAQEAEKRAALVQKVGKKYLQEKAESQSAQEAQSRVLATRKYLADKKSALVQKVKQNVQQTHDAVRGSLNARWNALREKIGPVNVDLAPIQKSIREAQDTILRGSPEKIAIFNNIIRESPGIEDASVFQGAGASARSGVAGTRGVGVQEFLRGIPAEKRPAFLASLSPEERSAGGFVDIGNPGEGTLSWNDARGYYTELGEKMFGGGEIPGDVYRALRHVRDSLDEELTQTADHAGAGQDYASVKKDWSEYENDFRNNRSLAVGGSPIIRILKAADPKYVETAALGPASSRALGTLLKYRKFGADPETLVALRKADTELSRLPKTAKEVKVPGRPELPAKKPTPEFVPPKKTDVPATDLMQERLKEIAKQARPLGRPSTFELINLAGALEEMLRGEAPYGLAYPALRRALALALKNKRLAGFVAKEGTK